jgi:sec-independent protein translocase protein TatA
MPNLGGWEFVILIGILVLLFGAKRLPDMARSIGQSARVFKGEMKGMKSDDASKSEQPADPQPALPQAQQTPAQQTPAQQIPAQQTPAQETQAQDKPATGKAPEPTKAFQPGSGSSPQ